jgi:hypothetical protein
MAFGSCFLKRSEGWQSAIDRIMTLYELMFVSRKIKWFDEFSFLEKDFTDFCATVLRNPEAVALGEVQEAILESAMQDRRLFSTTFSSKDYVEHDAYGACVPSAECNDLVVILYGCNCPILLREDDEEPGFHTTCTFVGDAYLSGYMFGEAVGKSNTRTYRIR